MKHLNERRSNIENTFTSIFESFVRIIVLWRGNQIAG